MMLSVLVAIPAPVQAQSASTSAADQLLQQYQQRQDQGGSTLQQPSIPQDIVLQPVQSNVAAKLPQSRLEQIISARAGARLEQFGYSQFGSGRTVVVPQAGSVQDDYILGPNDEIVVSLRGQEDKDFRAIVDRNGQVVLPRLDPISASGRSFGQFRADVEAAVRRSYVATTASVSIGRMRQISVLVSGEVNNPGQRIVTGLSSAVDALLLSGGIKKSGSLRNIRIQRGNREFVVDLYGVLTSRAGASNMHLVDGDRILVPTLGKTVAVAGLVRQPGIYELPSGRASIPVRDLMALSGGLEVRGQYRLSVLRILPDGRSSLLALNGEGGQIGESEILFVQLGADQANNQATLSGGTSLAGLYAIQNDSSLSDVLKAPGALGPAPYTLFGLIVRRDSRTLLQTLIAFTPISVLEGKENLKLQTGDVVRVFSRNEARLMSRAVCSYVSNVGLVQDERRNTLTQKTANFGAPTTQQSSTDLQRQTAIRDCDNDDMGAVAVSGLGTTQTVRRPLVDQYGDVLPSYRTQTVVPVQPANQTDQRSGNRSQQQNDFASGNFDSSNNAPNGLPNQNQGSQLSQQNIDYSSRDTRIPDQVQPSYDQSRPQEPPLNFQDQPVGSADFASNREIKSFRDLAIQLALDRQVLVNFLADHEIDLNGAVRGPGRYLIGPTVEIHDLILAAGGTSTWVDGANVEVISTAVDTNAGRAVTQRLQLNSTSTSYIVRPHDQIRFSLVYTESDAGTITLQGEVRQPGVYHITAGEHLSDLLMRAGGLTSSAYPYGTVFLRRSLANLEADGYQRAAQEIENQLVVAMTRVGTDKISPDTFAAMQSFVTDLRNQKAVGRVTVAADPSVLAAKPQLDPMLEGDDLIYIPPRPSTISVIGQVAQPGSFLYQPGLSAEEYVAKAGGYGANADDSETFIVLPDGSARKLEKSWLHFDSTMLSPGSAIFVPRNITPLDLRQTIIDVSQIFSQLAVSIASVAVLSKQ